MSLPTENASRITVTVDVPFSQQKAFEQWIQLVWLDGGGMGSPTIEEEGDMKAHRCGCIRRSGETAVAEYHLYSRMVFHHLSTSV